uniref:Ankyrin repeat domain-containing protein 11 n=1 Tax=Phallusia mammillata TaxID=59560 RepID=A0A6F9D684_9ASCI|nr:ankyrin repeat domain-containing protein 11 [Phallusia mammillata]
MEAVHQSDASKGMKRKISQEHSDEKNSEKKRKKKDGGRPKNCPLSERQQLALLMQMTAEESNEQAGTPPPQIRRTPGSSGRKDKVHKRNERGETPLHLATIRGDLNAITELIKQGADINVQDYAGWTPLHEACNHGYHDIAKYLLESGANVNSKGFENDYPLHDAVSNNHRALVGLLLKHGANPLLPNKHGERPMDLSESDVITKMMQQEVISSDESDSSQKTTSSRNKDSDRLKWRGRSESESDHSMKSSKHFSNTASRELFKSEKVLKKRTKSIVSSSVDSDDSDETPLIHQSRLSPQKHFSSSSSSNYDITNKRGLPHSDNKSRRKIKKKKSLFSTSTSEDSSSDTEKNIKKLKPPNIKSLVSHHSDSDSSEEEQIPLSQVLKSKKPSVTPTPTKPTMKLSAAEKPSETDVYDLTDDFSNESDAISLKPDTGRMFQKWQSPSKGPGLKIPSLFSRKTSVGSHAVKSAEKKTFKSAKDIESVRTTEKSSDIKTVLIRPASPPVKYQTSEMLFDELFKKHDSFETRITSTSVTTAVAITTATNSLYSSVARIVSPISSTATNTSTVSSVTMTTSHSAEPVTHANIAQVEDKMLPSFVTETLKPKPSAKVDESKKKRKSTEAENVKVEEKPKPLATSLKKGPQATVRSISLDTSNTVQTDKPKISDKSSEMKAVKKLQVDIKEKVGKTQSDPSKCGQKLASKVLEAKKSLPKPNVVKKEVKQEQKKVSLLSDSAFIGDIDSIARQRLLERQLQLKRKKKLQKRRESNPSAKSDEKKSTKRIDNPVAFAETPDKQKVLKLQHQKSIKMEAIETIHTAQNTQEVVSPKVTSEPELSIPVSTQPTITVPPLTANDSSDTKPVLPVPDELNDSKPPDIIPIPSTETPVEVSHEKDKAVEVPEDPANLESGKEADVASVEHEDVAEVAAVHDDHHENVAEQISESQKLLQEYIQQRLSMATICFETNEPKRLPEYIPMSKLVKVTKNPSNDRLNSYEERAFIQKLAYEKRKRLANIIPQAPQYYWEYMTFTGGYLLSGRKESHLSVPVLAPPPHLCDSMVELFNAHEEQRVRLRVQHAIEREKLIISCEQEIMREHCRAARTIQNQQVPYSACAVLMDNEVYNLPRSSNENETGKPSIRDRFNARLFISWLQDIDDKYEKMKSALLTRQKHEGETMYAMQKTEWILKLQELDHSQKGTTLTEINDLHVPLVNIADDFDLLPA